MNVGENENTNGNERRFMNGVQFLTRGFILLKLKVIDRTCEIERENEGRQEYLMIHTLVN